MQIMTDSPIRFPGLFGDWAFTASAKALDIGKGVYWYGIIIAIGLLMALLFCMKQRKKYGISEDDLLDGLLWGIPFGIIGARLYYVIFYLDLYRNSDGTVNWREVIAIWDGGLAIYGGVIATVIVALLLSRRRKFKIGAMLDLVVMGLLIGQIFGRWGNFMNREAFGAVTDVFCRMGLTSPDGTTIYVHPTFLYESLWNLGILIFLLIRDKKGLRKYDGQNVLIYFMLYGIGRAWIEGLRTDSLYIGGTGIRVSQALSVVLALASGIALFVNSRKEHKPEALYVNVVKARESAQAETESPRTL